MYCDSQLQKQGQRTLNGFVMVGSSGPADGSAPAPSTALPWPPYTEVRSYDASPGFLAKAVSLMGEANLDLATEAIVKVLASFCLDQNNVTCKGDVPIWLILRGCIAICKGLI